MILVLKFRAQQQEIDFLQLESGDLLQTPMMASALAHRMVTLFMTFVCTSAMTEITPTRLFINNGDDGSLSCSLKIKSDRSCYRSFSWYFVNTTEHETRVANIDSVQIGPYMDHFEAAYDESTTPNSAFKKCNYHITILKATTNLTGSYRCKLNTQFSGWASVVVIPDVEDMQPKCSVRVTNITHIMQDVELICKAYPVDPLEPAIRLAWLYQGDKISYRNNTSELGLLTTKSQVMPRNESSKRMDFMCQAYNSSDHPLANSCTLTWEVDISLHASMVYELGRPQGTYKCPFKMSLEGIRYSRQWMFDGEPIDLGNQTDRFIAEDHTGTLHMTEILPSDHGKRLTCMVKTMFGVYTAETLLELEGSAPTKAPMGQVPPPFPLSTSMIAIIVVGVALLVIINVCVCLVVIKSRGKRSRTMNQTNATSFQQEEGLYASGIVPSEGYLHMNGMYTGSYDPEDPYEAMKDNENKRVSEYQVPKVNADGSAIKKMQSVKYMNTMGGAKSRGFIFRFSRRKEEKHAKSEDGLGDGACGGGAKGFGPPPSSPNCYDNPKYNCDSSVEVPQFKTQENDYDELNLKSESADEN